MDLTILSSQRLCGYGSNIFTPVNSDSLKLAVRRNTAGERRIRKVRENGDIFSGVFPRLRETSEFSLVPVVSCVSRVCRDRGYISPTFYPG